MIGTWLARHARHRPDRLVLSNTAARLSAQVWYERIEAVKLARLSTQVDATMQRWFSPVFLASGDAIIDRTRANFLNVDPDG